MIQRWQIRTGVAIAYLFLTSLGHAETAPIRPIQHEVQLRIGEAAIMDWLRAATPYRFTVGSGLVSVDLVLSDPSDLELSEGQADLRVRIRGATIPIDETILASITVNYDRQLRKYFAVFKRLPIQIPRLGSIDLKDAIPRLEIPSLIEDVWRFPDRPVGLNLSIRRLAILDHAVEITGDVSFVPVTRRSTARRAQ
jgi:hypothetical protein